MLIGLNEQEAATTLDLPVRQLFVVVWEIVQQELRVLLLQRNV